jgi:hypothetical protein
VELDCLERGGSKAERRAGWLADLLDLEPANTTVVVDPDTHVALAVRGNVGLVAESSQIVLEHGPKARWNPVRVHAERVVDSRTKGQVERLRSSRRAFAGDALESRP